MDDVTIPQDDQDRIDGMVSQYRTQITNLYIMGHLQGAIMQVEEDRNKLKRDLTNAEKFARQAGLA